MRVWTAERLTGRKSQALFCIPRSVQFSHTSGTQSKTFRSYHAFRIAASPCR